FGNVFAGLRHGIDSILLLHQRVDEDYHVSREDQDAFAVRRQAKAAAAQAKGRLAKEITPVSIPKRKGDPVVVDKDEHPRETTIETMAK
ncbi:3-oxoadipyl-CoA thiolase, partial [Rhizobium ruizarguesonis]